MNLETCTIERNMQKLETVPTYGKKLDLDNIKLTDKGTLS